MINVSINETLGRTLATSVTTLAGRTAFLVLGGAVIQTFALAMLLVLSLGPTQLSLWHLQQSC